MKEEKHSRHHVIFPLVLVGFLAIGTVLTTAYVQFQQNIRSEAAGDCTVSAAQMNIQLEEQRLLDLMNQYRAQNGAGALVWNNALKKPAAWLSADMVASGNLNHTDSLGRTPEIRLRDCGYVISTGYGENIARGDNDAQAVLTSWKNSPPHNAIMLDPSYTTVGIAQAFSTSQGKTFWTVDFGGPVTSVSVSPTQITQPTISGTQPTTATTITSAPSVFTPTNALTPQPTQDPDQPAPTSSNIAVDMQISVKIKFNGVGTGGNTAPKNLSRRVQALIVGVDNDTPVTTGTGFLSYDGSEYFTGTIRLGRLNEGSYLIKFVGDTTLQRLAQPEFQTLLADRVNDVPPVTLYPGDMNEDNIMDITDFNIALTCFQNAKCETGKTIDFNDNGTTDVTDYNILLRTFGELQGK